MKYLAQMTQALIGIRLSAAQLSVFEQYERTLLEWNTRFNLTAIRDPEEVRIKHFLDSLTCLIAMRDTPMDRVIDVGSGAGFPGIPLKIICPAMHLTLVESVGKKAGFLRDTIKILGLENVNIVQERAETLGQMSIYREHYDWAVGRAVAVMTVLAEYLLPLVKVGGKILAMKGENGPAEAHAADHAMRLMGGHLRQLIPVTLPTVVEERYLIVVDKVAATPESYPRRIGVPSKKPL
jgi:16S rRNA (guanine527-N7)-methyltransferase